MLVIILIMIVIVALAALVVTYVAYPHRGQEIPNAPWLGEAMARAAEAAPVLPTEGDPGDDADRRFGLGDGPVGGPRRSDGETVGESVGESAGGRPGADPAS